VTDNATRTTPSDDVTGVVLEARSKNSYARKWHPRKAAPIDGYGWKIRVTWPSPTRHAPEAGNADTLPRSLATTHRRAPISAVL
jgi:hypothetical protein